MYLTITIHGCIANNQYEQHVMHVISVILVSLLNAMLTSLPDRPHNPMINSGAILMASLIKGNYTAADRFDFVSLS